MTASDFYLIGRGLLDEYVERSKSWALTSETIVDLLRPFQEEYDSGAGPFLWGRDDLQTPLFVADALKPLQLVDGCRYIGCVFDELREFEVSADEIVRAIEEEGQVVVQMINGGDKVVHRTVDEFIRATS